MPLSSGGPLSSSYKEDIAEVKNLPANAGDARDTGLILGLGRSPGGGNGNPPQYSCLENHMDRRAWGGGGGLQSVA